MVAMEVMYPPCAGLDVHKKLIVACVRLAEWLRAHTVTHAAMESTGV
jgi:hypothetical protein